MAGRANGDKNECDGGAALLGGRRLYSLHSHGGRVIRLPRSRGCLPGVLLRGSPLLNSDQVRSLAACPPARKRPRRFGASKQQKWRRSVRRWSTAPDEITAEMPVEIEASLQRLQAWMREAREADLCTISVEWCVVVLSLARSRQDFNSLLWFCGVCCSEAADLTCLGCLLLQVVCVCVWERREQKNVKLLSTFDGDSASACRPTLAEE